MYTTLICVPEKVYFSSCTIQPSLPGNMPHCYLNTNQACTPTYTCLYMISSHLLYNKKSFVSKVSTDSDTLVILTCAQCWSVALNLFTLYFLSLGMSAFLTALYDDIIKRKHFLHYWPFVGGIHRSMVNSPHKGQRRVALMFSLICTSINRIVRLVIWEAIVLIMTSL